MKMKKYLGILLVILILTACAPVNETPLHLSTGSATHAPWEVVSLRWTVVSLCETSSTLFGRNTGTSTTKGFKGEEIHGDCKDLPVIQEYYYKTKLSINFLNTDTGEKYYDDHVWSNVWNDLEPGWRCEVVGGSKIPQRCRPPEKNSALSMED